jgi:bicarbonate transport system substrate-binding protein
MWMIKEFHTLIIHQFKNDATLGYIAIVESAPLIIAKEKGFFDRHGMTNVDVAKQASWGAARDNIEIGSGGGGIDGGQWQMPMPYLISEGLITNWSLD